MAAYDPKTVALVKKILGNPELFPDEFKSWIHSYGSNNLFPIDRSQVSAELQPTKYVTKLPPNPFDGQTVVLVDDLSNPTYRWWLHYNGKSTNAYKWEALGGMSWRSNRVTTLGATGVTSFSDLPGMNSLAAPYEGQYEIDYRADTVGDYGGAFPGPYDIFLADVVNGVVGLSPFSTATASYGGGSVAQIARRTALVGQAIKIQYKQGNGTADIRVENAGFSVIPVRLKG